jgi:hypothetical protein
MPDSPLRFSLGSGQSLPCHLGWRIEDGYLRMTNWSDQADTVTLGIWGPGDLVIPSLIGVNPVELVSLSAIQVVEAKATLQDERRFLIDQVGQASALLKNLTHRHLAEIAGMTRVTVTKALSHYRQAGMMVREGSDELLIAAVSRL